MKIVVVGSGDVGYSVAMGLSKDGHDIVVVESDDERATKAENELDVMVVRGNGARPQILSRAGIHKDSRVDLLIACTNKDEVNLMSAWIGRRMGVRRIISRAVGLEFTDSSEWGEALGIDLLISPERSVAREVDELLEVRHALHATEVLSGKAGIYVFRVVEGSPACGVPIITLRRSYPDMVTLILYVVRGENGFIPRANDMLKHGDQCYSICYKNQAHDLDAIFRPLKHKALERVFILGGGKVGVQAARLLERRGSVEVKLVERDKAKAERLASELPGTMVLWGDGTDEDLLKYEGIEKSDGVVAATDSDESNLLLAVLAKHLGAAKSIAIVKNRTYMKMSHLLPIDAVVNRNLALSEVIIRSVRYPEGSKVLTVLDSIDAETLELTVEPGSPAAGVSLMELPLPQGVLIAMLTRGEDLFIPMGSTVIQADDRVVLFAKSETMPEAVRVMGAGADE